MSIMNTKLYEIHSDGRTVWVNAASCLGRFGIGGIDIHRSVEDQEHGKTECLFCTHALTTAADWDLFVVKMEELHGIKVPEKYKPKRLRVEADARG